MEKIAVYPGSFDPPTNGHIDIVDRALTIFDRVIVAVTINPSKKTLFTVNEREDMLRKIFAGYNGLEITSFEGLLVDYVKKKKASTIIRGLRAVADFEYEFQMALMNRRLDPEIKSVYLMPSPEFSYLSSSLIKEVYGLGGKVEGLIPAVVEEYLKTKYSR